MEVRARRFLGSRASGSGLRANYVCRVLVIAVLGAAVATTCKSAVGVGGARSGGRRSSRREHVSAQALQEDPHLTVRCHNGPTEPGSEGTGRFPADPNAVALSAGIPEGNRAGEASSPGNLWFPHVFGVSKALV